MLRLPQHSKSIFAKKIRHYKGKCFPGKGGGVRLAEEIGATPQSISNWIHGSKLPSMSQMYSLAKAFDVSPLELCGMRRKRTLKTGMPHIAVFQKLLQYCENENTRGGNPRVTRDFLLSIIGILDNELCE